MKNLNTPIYQPNPYLYSILLFSMVLTTLLASCETIKKDNKLAKKESTETLLDVVPTLPQFNISFDRFKYPSNHITVFSTTFN